MLSEGQAEERLDPVMCNNKGQAEGAAERDKERL